MLTFALLALAALALGDLHVLHHLLKLLQQLLRLRRAALAHQLLNPFEQLIKLVLGDLLALTLLALLVLALLAVGVAHGLLGQLLHVVVHRFAQLLHQLINLSLIRALPDRLRQTLLGAAQFLKGVFKRSFLNLESRLPQNFGNVFLDLRRQIGVGLKPTNGHPHKDKGRRIGKGIIGAVGQRTQNLGHARAIRTGPQQIAPLFDQRMSQRVEKALPRQHHLHRIRAPRLAQRILRL